MKTQNIFWKNIVMMVLICVVLCGCGSQGVKSSTQGTSQKQSNLTANTEFEQCILDSLYSDAIEVYNEEIAGNATKENEARLFIEEFLFNQLNAYSVGTLSAEEMDVAITTVEKVDNTLNIATDILTLVEQSYDEIAVSKNWYESGIENMQAGEYEAAVHAFSNVVEADTEHYIDSQEKIEEATNANITKVMEQAKSYVEDGAFAQALDIINTADLDQNNPELATTKDEIKNAWRNDLLQQANDMVAAGDYENAIWTLNNASENIYNEALSSRVQEIYELWKDDVIAQVNKMVAAEDYVGALSILDQTLIVFEGDADMQGLLDEVEALQEEHIRRTTPISLADLEPYANDGLFDRGSDEDIMGNEYANVISAAGPTSSATYRIDGIYANFSGAFFIDSKKTGTDRKVTILGDGMELFSDIINGAEEPTNFSIDVTGIRNLEIIMESSVTGAAETLLGDPILTP